MLADALTLLFGLALLVYGGERAVAGASTLARELGVSTFFVGVTLVAVGSSLPEIATSVYAAAYGAGSVVVGHIVGSATSQITLGIGVVALLSPLSVSRAKLRTYGVGMLAAMAAMGAALWSGDVSRLEGVVMAGAYLAFMVARFDDEDYDGGPHRRWDSVETRRAAVVWLAVGLALVAGGGHLLVTAARDLAVVLGVPPLVIGIVTGLGTTTPEIAIAALADHRGRPGIAVGTLLGSNITDPLFSLGVGAVVESIVVAERMVTLTSVGYMLVVSAGVLALLYDQEELGRAGGAACCLAYLPLFWFF